VHRSITLMAAFAALTTYAVAKERNCRPAKISERVFDWVDVSNSRGKCTKNSAAYTKV